MSPYSRRSIRKNLPSGVTLDYLELPTSKVVQGKMMEN
jgi:hypothetical protein